MDIPSRQSFGFLFQTAGSLLCGTPASTRHTYCFILRFLLFTSCSCFSHLYCPMIFTCDSLSLLPLIVLTCVSLPSCIYSPYLSLLVSAHCHIYVSPRAECLSASHSAVLDLLPWEDTFCPIFLPVTQTVCIWHLSATPVLDILFPLLLHFQTADVLFTYFTCVCVTSRSCYPH